MRQFNVFPGSRPTLPLALAIGVFDGVHLGHQAVLKGALALARQRGWIPAVLAFDPPPEVALGLPVPPRVGDLDEQAELMAALGLQRLYRVPFTAALGRMSPERFAGEILSRRLRCGAVAVGRGFRFGARARGTVATLKALGQSLGNDRGFAVAEAGPVLLGREAVSSTRLRRAIQIGRLDRAEALLGRPWRWRGTVVRGRRLGRTLGFPTANLEGGQILPPRGVWVGRVRVLTQGTAGAWWGFAGNLGLRPTVDLSAEPRPSVELHLLGFKGRLEGRVLEAEFRRRLRPERRFPSLDALSAQISRDVRAAERFLQQAR
ncbi:MAG: riboflavin biosynthesis protein RibF [bacterium]